MQAYVQAGQVDKAEALLTARLEKEPGDGEARLALAALYLQRKQYDTALHEYESVLAASPSSVPALNNLAWLYQRQGDITKARELAERAIAIEPKNASVADTLGWIMAAQGNNDEALKYLKAAGASSHDPEIQYHLAVTLERAGQMGEAKALLERILGSGNSFQSKPEAEKMLRELTKS